MKSKIIKKIKIFLHIKKYHRYYVVGFTSLILLFGFFIGYIWSSIKYIPPHFHANFAMYIGDQRVDFSGDKYQEDVAGCSLTNTVYPESRVHLHENNQDTIHIHSDGVSWGHFFANNGFLFNETMLITDSGEKYEEEGKNLLIFILNGEQIKNPYNRLIESEDRLLIYYGEPENQKLTDLFKSVSSNAGEYNSKYDPGSCGGTNENGLLVVLRDLFHHKH